MEPHRVLQETAYPSLAYGLFGLGRFLQQIPDSYKRVIFMSICGSIRLSLDRINPGGNRAVIQILYQRQISPVPMAILEIWHVCDVRHQSKQRFVSLKSSVEQIVRQILYADSSRMRPSLAILSDACTEIVSTHHSLQPRLTNADTESSLQQRIHATVPDRKEKIALTLAI